MGEDVIVVDGHTFKCPSSMKWKKSDISGANSGRTNDANATMHKNRIAKKRTLSLGWRNLSKREIHAILNAFKPEYVDVTYWDPEEGEDATKKFYTGDMDAEVYSWSNKIQSYSTLSFDIIEV